MSISHCTYMLTVTMVVMSCLAPGNHVRATRMIDRQVLRKFFGCPTCDPDTCPAPLGPPDCPTVLEPGVCGCCQVCARLVGETCGLSSGRCAKGLSCRPRPGDPDPLGSLLDGTAVCV